VAQLFALLATAALGLLAGAMLLIAVALTPFWAALEPLAFARWFQDHSLLLARGRLDAAQVAAELGRWRIWHALRTGAGVLGFLAALRGLMLSAPAAS